MKRLVVALIILATGTTVFCALHHSDAQFHAAIAANRDALTVQTQLVATARGEWTVLTERVRELKRTLPARSLAQEEAGLFAVIRTNDLPQLSAAQREQLLAELGFNWNTTGDYLVVSKATLRDVSMDGLKGMQLTDVASSVLAITPEERATIEGEAARLREDYKSWVETHVQREEPTGDIVAKYQIPADAEFARGCSNRFTSGVLTTLGRERGELLLDYARDWMSDLGMYGGEATTMTVKRYKAGETSRLNVEVRRMGGIMSTDVSPYQFPGPFRAIFPGGWPDVAKREGFDLPKEFNKEPKQP